MFQVEDTTGIELFATLHHVARISEMMETQFEESQGLSGSRWRLLLRLRIEEEMGNREGLSPTVISQAHRVSKNTISSLLRGLEEQGLIQRNLDPDDLRVFRIQLTPAGRELVQRSAPQRIERLNRLLCGFEKEEMRQFIGMLTTLQHSLLEQMQDEMKQDIKESSQ